MSDLFYTVFYCAGALIMCAVTLLLARRGIHMLQLESYYLRQYLKHMFKGVLPLLCICGLACLSYAFFNSADIFILPVCIILILPFALKKRQEIKPLKYTARVKRMLCLYALIILAVCALCVWRGFYYPIYLLRAFNTALVFLSALAAKPLEWGIREGYILSASRRLKKRPDLKIVGITGSYGKTSVKFILSAILKQKYSVLTPPSSYNTTMGVVRVIRERLALDDQIFICEMGARHKGDIKDICRFVHPDCAIITSIGPQHLETFGSMERLRDSKFELIEGLKSGGTAFFPRGNEYAKQMYERAQCEKYYFGFVKDSLASAEDISSGPQGSEFTLILGGQSVRCRTKLLGRHNIQNILAAAACAYKLGLSLEQIERGICGLEPVEHRLKIIASSPMTVIDDAFNSSPNGARAALEVLAQFKGRRIIVTPGFVELGPKQDEYHFQLGCQIAESADIAILVLPERTAEIKRGLLEKGFEPEKIYEARSLQEAAGLLEGIGLPGDTVLFENDLPDNYA